MPGTGNKPLQEHNVAAERAQRLLPGALECPGEVVWRGDDTDASTAAARSGLKHQRIADTLGRRQRVSQARNLTAAPRSDGNAGLLGDQLGTDLVAQLAH